MTNEVILEKLKRETDVAWTEAVCSTELLAVTSLTKVRSVALAAGQCRSVLTNLNPKLAAKRSPAAETGKEQIEIDVEKLEELEKRKDYFSKKGISPLLYTVNANQHIKTKYDGYVVLGIETDFSEPTTARKLVSLVGNERCERLFIDLDSQPITSFLVAIEKTIEEEGVKSDEAVLNIVNNMIDELSTKHPSVKGQTRAQVEMELNGRVNIYLDNRKLGLIADKPANIDIPLDELIDQGLLVCRHKGVLAAIAVGHLIQKKILLQGSARSYRSEIHNKDGQMIGAHAWAVYCPILGNEMLIVDPRWLKVDRIDIKNPTDIGYGLPAVRGMVERLVACDDKFMNKFERAIKDVENIVELVNMGEVLKSKHGVNYPDLAKIIKNPVLMRKIAETDAVAIAEDFKEALVNHVGNDPKQKPLLDRLKALDPQVILDAYFPNTLGLRDHFVKLVHHRTANHLVANIEACIATIRRNIAPNLYKTKIKPCLEKLEQIAKQSSGIDAVEQSAVVLDAMFGSVLSENGGMIILYIKDSVEGVLSDTRKMLQQSQPATQADAFDRQNPDQDTLFHMIARDNRQDLWKLCENLGTIKNAELVDLKLKNKHGKTALHEALDHDNLELAASMLLSRLSETMTMLSIFADLLKWKSNQAKLQRVHLLLPEDRRYTFSRLLEIAIGANQTRHNTHQQNNKFLAAVKLQAPEKVTSYLHENSGYLAKPWHDITSMRGPKDNTALHEIAKMKDQAKAQALVEALANFKVRKSFSLETYLPHEIVDLDARNKNGLTSFEKAVSKGRFDTATAMLQLYTKERQAPLKAIIEDEKKRQKIRLG